MIDTKMMDSATHSEHKIIARHGVYTAVFEDGRTFVVSESEARMLLKNLKSVLQEEGSEFDG